MPDLDSDGLDYDNELCMGVNELSWLQAKYQEELRHRILGNMASPGFVARAAHAHVHAWDYGWAVYDPLGGGVLTLKQPDPSPSFGDRDLDQAGQPWRNQRHPRRILAFDRQGYALQLRGINDLDIDVTVPNDGVWRTLVARRLRTKQEPGSLTLTTGSPNVTGVNTVFTNHIGKSDPSNPGSRGDLLRIDAADTVNGNDGTYEIDTVVSDTALTLVTPILGTNETGVPYQIAGSFLIGTPADPGIHNNTTVQFELVTRQIPDASDDDLIVADVMRTGGLTTIVDRRHSNIYRPVSRAGAQFHGYKVLSEISMLDDADSFILGTPRSNGLDFYITPLVGDANRIATALAEDSESILIVSGDALGNLDALTVPIEALDGGGSPSATFSNFATSGFDPQLVAVPSGYGLTHICVYQSAQTISIRTTTDNGATWSGATVIWNPTLIDASDSVGDPAIILTRDHRLIVVGSYFDNSEPVNQQYSIRAVWSDNIGDSPLVWDSNTNAGYTVADNPSREAFTPDIAQDDEGNLFIAFAMTDVNHDTIRLVRGQDANNPQPGGQDGEQIDGTYIGERVNSVWDDLFGAERRPRGPRIWCGPSGILVFYTHTNHDFINTIQTIACASVGWFDSKAKHVGFSRLRNIDTNIASPGGPLNSGLDIVQTPDGTIQLFYVYDDDGIGVQGVWQPVVPVRCDRPSNTFQREPF